MVFFKDFDKQFAHFQNTILPDELSDAILELAGSIKGWSHGYFQPSPLAVQEAVYNSTTSTEWQQFRVSLKGQRTSVKLARLELRWQRNIRLRSSMCEEFVLEVTRMMNYIGALKRGGLINDDLEIVN